MKVKRHNKILEIIENNNIETQEELIAKLRLAGFDVTQATVSRDMRDLKLTKQMSDTGAYRYVVATTGTTNHHVYSRAITHSIKSVEYALNNVVIKTYPGMANAVAAGIDTLRETGILGCVAGDDCIIVVTRTEADSDALTKHIQRMIAES